MKSSKVHLNRIQRDQIELSLNEDMRLIDIANTLGRDPRGIKEEIVKHRQLFLNSKNRNICGLKDSCKIQGICSVPCANGLCKFCGANYCNDICELYDPRPKCKRCIRYPYVCNGCDKIKTCKMNHFYYRSHIAQKEYEENVSVWKRGCKTTTSKLKELNEVISDGVRNGISLDIIKNENNISQSLSTLYRWVDEGLFDVKSINLPRKCRYRVKRRKKVDVYTPTYDYLKGRTFNDFQIYLSEHFTANIWQLDTVEGLKGKDAVMSLLHTKSNLQLYFKISSICQSEIIRVFNFIKSLLGDDLFKEIFECILTDNGKEFKDPLSIVTNDDTGEVLTELFYCEPRRSDQKGKCEKNHEHFRVFIPKGIDITPYKDSDINYISFHVNNYPRKSLGYKTPIEVYKALGLNEKTFDLNNLHELELNKVKIKRFYK